MDTTILLQVLGTYVVGAPAVLFAILSTAGLIDRRLPEAAISRLIFGTVVSGLVASIAILVLMLSQGTYEVPVNLGNWVAIEYGHTHFHFSVKFIFDRLSVPFCILSYVLCGTVSAFASVYMHREPGYARFFILYSMFLLGIVVSFVAGTVETLFAGWELVGLSSAFLVAFFHERPVPVRNGLRVWSVYRFADAAFLIAAVILHRLTGEGDFHNLMGTGPWPFGQASLTHAQAFFVGLLLLIAAAGKSALVPFSGWLPRAMEGPTPSSAIFYGALSIHLGAYLLLRVSPILELSIPLCAIVVALGLITAVYGALVGRVQTDIKSALSFACLTQIGIIVMEIGLGFRYLALIHIVGHACLRTLQFVRAPSLLNDYRTLENAIGAHLPHVMVGWEKVLPTRYRLWIYRFAIERGFVDGWLMDYLVQPFLRFFRWCESLERRWIRFLTFGDPHRSDAVTLPATTLEDLS